MTITASPLVTKYTPPVFSLFIASMMVFGFYAVLVTGPAMRATTEKQLSQTTLDETRTFCAKLGISDGSDEFAMCSKELAIVRQKQTERDSAAAQGILELPPY